MTHTGTLLDQLAALAAEPVGVLRDGDLLTRVSYAEELGRLADALRVTAAAEVEARSRIELGPEGLSRRMGHARASHLVEQLTRASASSIASRLTVGRMIAPRATLDGTPLLALYPRVAAAVGCGEIGIDVARVITHNLEQAAPSCSVDDLATAETALVDQALSSSADLVAIQARIWRDTLDPDGTLPREERLHTQRSLRIGRERDGMARVTLDTSGVNLAEIRAIFGAYASPRITPRFRDESDIDPASPDLETRTNAQRGHDVFMGLVRAGHQSDATRPGPRVAVHVTVRENDLQTGTGVAWLDDVDEPIAASSIDELVCSGGTRKAVIDESGAVLHLGQTERYFTPAQQTALAIRDGGCAFPGCTAPPAWTDAHHALFWKAHDGPTDVDNGVLLCPPHHRLLHSGGFHLKMLNGVPYFRAPAHLDPTRAWRRGQQNRALTALRR
ncbi:HNH endonuclease [Glaciihabitans arcticus]|uniref:HNH endonuclease n=1 Tax=Glaciihabitans arcticus TaxID=2668039 RepID=A0A4Q9GN49_9MICO|nr:HNH endonuclease signature motif containing protein [Glaciihabitans arcticus]TBN56126.1 HNH endonuclease [Glaciihabitans arcticus]